MACFTGTLRGDGLVRAQRALARLQEDPMRLDRERQRFDHSPPPYISNPSGSTTRSPSPITSSEERRQERRFQLGLEHRATQPYCQFRCQIGEEKQRVWNANLNRTRRLKVGDDPDEMAYKTVKKRWVEQGIWNSKWNQFASGRWKHEEPLEPESESETDSQAGPSSPLFSFFQKPQPKPRRPKSDDEKRRIAERRVIREREHEASRPYHQFIYQISKERERIQEESENGEGADAADINTRAYENVKNIWIKRRIWNGRWGVLPGMSWKHEQPFEDFVEAADSPAPVPTNPFAPAVPLSGPLEGEATDSPPPVPASPLAPARGLFGPLPTSGIFGRREGEATDSPAPIPANPLAPARGLFGPLPTSGMFGPREGEAADSPAPVPANPLVPGRGLFGLPSPVPLNHRQTSGASNSSSQQAPPVDIDPARLENSDAECSSTSITPPPDWGKSVCYRQPWQPLLPIISQVSIKDWQPVNASFGSVHSSEVSKSAGKRKGPQRRLNISPKVSTDGLPLSSGVDAAAPQPSPLPDRVTRRRSKRLLSISPKVSFDGLPLSSGVDAAAPQPSPLPGRVTRRRSKRLLNISPKVSSDGLPLSSGVDAAAPQPSPLPGRVTRRRSKRLQPTVPIVSKEPTRTASRNPSKRAVRLKPERNVASSRTARSSAKPQGISKKQPAKIAQGKARKK